MLSFLLCVVGVIFIVWVLNNPAEFISLVLLLTLIGFSVRAFPV